MNAALQLIHGGSSNVRMSGRIFLSERNDEWHLTTVKKLEELIRLQQGWDGYRALPVSLANASFALRMLESTCLAWTPTPQIVPGTSGDLQIEWHTHNGDIELHVFAPNHVHAWRVKPEHENGEALQLTNDFTEVAHWVREIAELPIAPRAAAA